MLNRFHGRRPSPALVVSIIALIMSMAGTAFAAKVLIKSSSQIATGAVSSSDIRDGAVSRGDLRNSAIDGNKIRNGSVGVEDLAAAARGSNAGTDAIEAIRRVGPQGLDSKESARVATLKDIPPGTYAIFAKTILTPVEAKGGLFKEGESVSGHCSLDAEGERDEARALLSSPGSKAPGILNLQLTRSFDAAGTVGIDCDVTNATWNASDTSIIAIRVGRAPRHPVEG